MMKPVYERARADLQRVVYAEGEEETVLRAVQTLVEEQLARPILIGRPEVIETRIERHGLRLRAGEDYELTNLTDHPRVPESGTHYPTLTDHHRGTHSAATNQPRGTRALTRRD